MKRLLLAAALGVAGVAGAQDAPTHIDEVTESAVIPGVSPGPRPPAAQVDDIARDIASRLRCTVCQGLSVADSTSAGATQMHHRVRELVAAGYDRAQIEDYFVSKYGEWILLEPRSDGINVILWVGPLAGLALAFVVSGSLVARRKPEERDPDTMVDERAAAPAEDPHTARLLEEVDRD